MIKIKFLLLYVLGILLFTNFLFSQTSLDDFDFSELDNYEFTIIDSLNSNIIMDVLKWEDFRIYALELLEKPEFEFKKEGFQQIQFLRDPRFIPILIDFINDESNIDYIPNVYFTFSCFSDTTGLNIYPYPFDALEYGINELIIPCLENAISDTTKKNLKQIAYTLYFLGDIEKGFEIIRTLVNLNYYSALDGFYFRPSFDSLVYDPRAFNFFMEFIDSPIREVKAYVALYFANINRFDLALPIVNEIFKLDIQDNAFYLANLVKQKYERWVANNEEK